MGKHTILFLAANPSGTNSLALDQEARAIQVALERSQWQDSVELVTRWAAEPLDLLRELRKAQADGGVAIRDKHDQALRM